MFRNFAYVNPDSNYIFWHSSQAKRIGGPAASTSARSEAPTVDEALDTARRTNDPTRAQRRTKTSSGA